MNSLENMLSPMIKQSSVLNQSNNLSLDNVELIEKIRKQKMDVIHKRISPNQVDSVRPEIVESWIRSSDYGFDPLHINFGPTLDDVAFQKILKENKSLLEVADFYIERLDKMLFNTNCSIVLSDDQGVILRVFEGKDVSVCEKGHMNPGTVWNEKTVGTLSHGLCLLLEEPIQICGPEHFCEYYDQVIASSAPIFDLNHNLAGTLSISSYQSQDQNPHTLGLAVSMAWAIQNDFQVAVHNKLFTAALEATEEAVLTINQTGIIIMANIEAKRLFHHQINEVAGQQIKDILGNHSIFDSVLELGKPVFDVEIEIEQWNQKLLFHSLIPVRNDNDKIIGCVVTLKKNDRVKKSGQQINLQDAKFTFDDIIGASSQMIDAKSMAEKFASLDVRILITGENGTGKELFAQSIHNKSRPNGPFTAVNCVAIPKNLIESELFGYEGGAFTGAERQGRPGKIELANHGTLFLDEIGDMPLELQPVLLRVLEEKKVMRVGGSRYISVDFRLLAATNKDLLAMIKDGLFREDLYYRLAVFKLIIPPLRERGSDIINLANYYIKTIAKRQSMREPYLSDETKIKLLMYDWPGNVRQLENTMIYAVNMSSNGVIKPENLPSDLKALATVSNVAKDKAIERLFNQKHNQDDSYSSIKELEKMAIVKALLQTGNRVAEASGMLGLSRTTLYRKLKEYNINTNL